MTFSVTAWAKNEIAALENKVAPTLKAEEAAMLAWVHNFLADMTPVIKQAADDAVIAAVSMPGSGEAKAAAAFATASAVLISKGIPIADADLKTAIQISYKALPATLASAPAAQAVVNAADAEVDAVAAKAETKA